MVQTLRVQFEWWYMILNNTIFFEIRLLWISRCNHVASAHRQDLISFATSSLENTHTMSFQILASTGIYPWQLETGTSSLLLFVKMLSIVSLDSPLLWGLDADPHSCWPGKNFPLDVSPVNNSDSDLRLLKRWGICPDWLFSKEYEPPHNKSNKMTGRPSKTQISLGIWPVWSESLLCAQWVAEDSSFLHADSEDSDQMHMPFCWFCHEVAQLFIQTEVEKYIFLNFWWNWAKLTQFDKTIEIQFLVSGLDKIYLVQPGKFPAPGHPRYLLLTRTHRIYFALNNTTVSEDKELVCHLRKLNCIVTVKRKTMNKGDAIVSLFLIDWLTDWLTDRLTDWLDRLTDRPTDWPLHDVGLGDV